MRSNGEFMQYTPSSFGKRSKSRDILESNGKSIVVMNAHEGDVIKLTNNEYI